MNRNRSLRLLLALGVLLGLVLLLSTTLNLAAFALEMRERMAEAPLWFVALVGAVIALFLVFGLWVVWRILRPGGDGPVKARPPEPLSEAALRDELAGASGQGVPVGAAAEELAALDARREAGQVVVALFGEISTGKSALIRALIPGAEARTDVVGGTTVELQRYAWQRPSGDQVEIVDMPGVNQLGRDYDRLAREEAQRAHLVVYLLDGDLRREQQQALTPLLALGKPLVVAVNKLDQYSRADQAMILEQVRSRFDGQAGVEVVGIAAQPVERRIEVDAQGQERETIREWPPEVEPLREALHRALNNNPKQLEQLRDKAVFALAEEQLRAAQREFRDRQAAKITRRYTQKAVVGGMAAIGPGTDLIIQGVFGTGMVRELAALHGVKAREIEIEKLLDAVQGRVGKATPVLMAIAGNTLKAFPGLGTVAGGLLHAVAYGLLFDTLGDAVHKVLTQRGALATGPINELFEDQLRDDLESRAKRLARLAVGAARQQDDH